MNALSPDTRFAADHVEVLIVGAGISGIGMAAHLEMMCPGKSYRVVDRRPQLGGTWDLFRYPGIRSDSDMHTLGFIFEPWKDEKSIADGPAILEYLDRIVDERGIRAKMRFGQKVVSADWQGNAARWHVVLKDEAGTQTEMTAGWLYLGSGYYDYDSPFDAQLPGSESFGGQIVHPQFWPKDLDYQGKKVVVIGSGATAVTIVPALASSGAGFVTMLQRTPTWMASRPAKDRFANTLRKFLPESWAYAVTRKKNVWMQDYVFKMARNKPQKLKDALTKQIKAHLGDKYDEQAFTPPYNPWEQRLCLVPDGDFFEAMKADKAGVVTDRIDRIDATGILLKSGQHLDADIIITATGLSLAVAGKIAVSIDGERVDWSEHFYYKGAMFSNVPNLSAVFGYLNASWTLRADIISEYVCKVLNHMDRVGAKIATPYLPADHALVEDDIFDFSSGYIQRGKHIMPRNAAALPWRLSQDYRKDREDLKRLPIDDGVLKFSKMATAAATPELEAAE